MTDPQCMVHTAPATATGTDTAVVCQTKHRHQWVENSCHRNKLTTLLLTILQTVAPKK